MDITTRRAALVEQLTKVQQAINVAVVQAHQLEGAIAILDEQLKEQAEPEKKD